LEIDSGPAEDQDWTEGGEVLIWERPERAARGPRPTRSRDEITAAAMAIADAEGIEAVSMRRVAAAIGTGTTSLYRYVRRKDELFDLMLDAAIGETEPPSPTGDWRRDLGDVAGRTRALILRHPWMAGLTAGRPVLGPNNLRFMEGAIEIVEPLGLDIDSTYIVIETLMAFVRGYALKDLAEREASRRTGMDFARYIRGQARYGLTLMLSGRYPLLTRYWIEAQIPHAPDREDRSFALGLERVLDGIAAAIPRP
jgi:AcrR family transcriptional regulator